MQIAELKFLLLWHTRENFVEAQRESLALNMEPVVGSYRRGKVVGKTEAM